MMEIDEIIPYYICDQQKECRVSCTCVEDCCRHTTDVLHFKNQASVELLNKFFDTFHVCLDDNGRLLCTERISNG